MWSLIFLIKNNFPGVVTGQLFGKYSLCCSFLQGWGRFTTCQQSAVHVTCSGHWNWSRHKSGGSRCAILVWGSCTSFICCEKNMPREPSVPEREIHRTDRSFYSLDWAAFPTLHCLCFSLSVFHTELPEGRGLASPIHACGLTVYHGASAHTYEWTSETLSSVFTTLVKRHTRFMLPCLLNVVHWNNLAFIKVLFPT